MLSAVPDFIYPQTRGKRPRGLEEKLKSTAALTRLATRDPAVFALITEIRHLLKPLGVLDNPELKRRIEEEVVVVFRFTSIYAVHSSNPQNRLSTIGDQSVVTNRRT